MKRFRYVEMHNSDALMEDLVHCLAGWQEQLLGAFSAHWARVKAAAAEGDAAQADALMNTLRLMARVFFRYGSGGVCPV